MSNQARMMISAMPVSTTTDIARLSQRSFCIDGEGKTAHGGKGHTIIRVNDTRSIDTFINTYAMPSWDCIKIHTLAESNNASHQWLLLYF